MFRPYINQKENVKMKRKIILATLAIGITSLVMIGCNSNEIKYLPDTQTETLVDENTQGIDISKFIPNGTYKVSFEGSDMANELIIINGNGIIYQTVGVNGKGFYNEEYKVVNNQLLFVDNEELDNADNIPNINTDVNINEELENYEVVLRPNTDKSDKLQISEIGKDLKLKNIELKGDYVKTTKDISTGDNKTYINTYYSEGLGIVKYEVVMDEDVMEYSEIISYEEMK